jgi:pilus assembly protein Flp/PilA
LKFLRSIFHEIGGATAIEYGLICALISIAAMTAMGGTGQSINQVFEDIKSQISGA